MTLSHNAGFTALLTSAAFFLPVLFPGQSDAVDQQPVVKPALDGLFEAFDTHPLVGLADRHQVAQVLDFYQSVVRDPRFATQVGHVVVEFGTSAHQEVIDRYVFGENVPYAELRKVWTETPGWVPAVPSEGYARFFAQVRETNLELTPRERIKVWLGEPPIDWSAVETRADWQEINQTRDSHAAQVIIHSILAKNRKALVIFGGGHLRLANPSEKELLDQLAAEDPKGPWTRMGGRSLRDLVEKEYPGSFFVVQTYRGFRDENCTSRFEAAITEWPLPALAVSVRGTALERQLRECLSPVDVSQIPLPPTIPENLKERVRAAARDNVDRNHPLVSDSLLILAPAADLTIATPFVEFALDEEWRTELGRRYELMRGRPLPRAWGREWGRGFPSSPVPYLERD